MNICEENQIFMFDLEILVKTITPITNLLKKRSWLGKFRMRQMWSGCQYLLNVIVDKFVDCKFIIHYYTQFTVHKLVQNCI